MKEVRLICLVLVSVVILSTVTACGYATNGGGFEARDIAFHSEYTTYYDFDEVEPYLQAYFKSIETACHQVLEKDEEDFSLSEAGQAAQRKLEHLQKVGDANTQNGDSTTRLKFLNLFKPYLKVRTQELTANLAISMGNPTKDSCQALLDVLNEAHDAYAAAP